MKKTFVLFCALWGAMMGAMTCAAPAQAAPMRVRQPVYGFEFDVDRTADMPANWWKTYDGFYVTRRLDTNWVYGRETAGGLVVTDVLVGSVDPRAVMGLGEAYRPEGLSLSKLDSGQEQEPVYMPPEPDASVKTRPWQSSDWGKTKNPAYLGELKEIIKGLRVTQDDFKKVYLYSYPYLASRHFKTRVPLDFYIVHQRETGHVELFMNMGVKARFTPTLISFNFDGYDGEVCELFPLPFESDGGFAERRAGDRERAEFWEQVAYLFNKQLFRKWWPTLRGYGLRLASNKNSTTLPSPVYTSLIQKIVNADKVEIRLGDEGDFIRSGSSTRYKLRGWPDLIWIFQIDEKKRFAESLEARFETYRKLVELEKRWQGPVPEPQPQVASWPQNRPLRADLIYDIMEAGDFEALTSRLNQLLGEPQVQGVSQAGARTGAQMNWTLGDHIRVGLRYLFEGGTWRRNKWEWVSSSVVETWEDARRAFDARVGEFTEMLGTPRPKKTSEATWVIGDGVKFTLRLAGNHLFYTSNKKGPEHTVIETVR